MIVGFPGETEADFRETLEVVEEAGFDSAFTFVYSPRAGTEAATMPDQVPHETKIERMERLVELTQRIARERNEARVGRVEEVLVEGPSRTDDAVLRGRTRRNTTVNFAGDAAAGELVPVRIEARDVDDPPRLAGRARRCVIVALFGPTASGKSAVAGALLDRLDAEVVSADSAALYAGIPIVTAAPEYPARLVGVFPLDHDVSVGEYQRLAHDAIDDVLAAGRVPIVVGGTGLYFRAALGTLDFPPPPEPGERERWSRTYDELGADGAHELLAGRDPGAAARVHPNDRRRVVRALELSEAGATLAGDRPLGRRAASSDAGIRARPRRREARQPHPRPGEADARRGWGRGGRRGVGAAAFGDGAEGARPRAACDAPARGGDRRRRHGDAPPRAVPAEVDPPAAGCDYARREAVSGGARG